MTTLSMLSAQHKVPAHIIRKIIQKTSGDFDDEDFEINSGHQKAVDSLRGKKIGAYALAYGIFCYQQETREGAARFESINEVAEYFGHSLEDEISALHWQKIETEKLPNAKHWIDRASALAKSKENPDAPDVDAEALDRIARWCKWVLRDAFFSRDHNYLAVRLLLSLPPEVMANYPNPVRKTLGRLRSRKFLDGWWRSEPVGKGRKMTVYFRPDQDL